MQVRTKVKSYIPRLRNSQTMLVRDLLGTDHSHELLLNIKKLT